jgi:hypothetical protein
VLENLESRLSVAFSAEAQQGHLREPAVMESGVHRLSVLLHAGMIRQLRPEAQPVPQGHHYAPSGMAGLERVNVNAEKQQKGSSRLAAPDAQGAHPYRRRQSGSVLSFLGRIATIQL